MLAITADTFVICWEEFLQSPEHRDGLFKCYDSINDRTCAILGNKGSSSDASPLGKHIINMFPDYAYRKEDGGIDISVYKKEFLKNIMNMWFDDKSNVLSLEKFPCYFDVLIEHENKPEIAYEEMAKLTYFNANLKVLIVHLWITPEGDDSYEEAHNRLAQNFLNIIKQANQRFPENIETSYLLITVQKIGNSLVSKYSSFEVMSMIKQEYVAVQKTEVWKTSTINL